MIDNLAGQCYTGKDEEQTRGLGQGPLVRALGCISGGMEVLQPLLSSSLSVPLLSLGKTETHHKRVENILLEIKLRSIFLRCSHMN